MRISIIVPMYNEAENIENLVSAISNAMAKEADWELLLANDGSLDSTLKIARNLSTADPRIKVVTYDRNIGQGYALREGFKKVTGDILVTLDADLSYDPMAMEDLIQPIKDDHLLDMVIGSPYMKGGGTDGVPLSRLILSKGANKLLSWALPGNIKTITGMFRAYRRELIETLDLASDDKEIHFEILSKALSVGAKAKEVPAVLRGRAVGRSSIRVWASIVSHVLFSLFERPALFFEGVGFILLALGLISGGYIVWLWQHGDLDPMRPLMILMVLLIVVGALILSFGFIASQILQIRKEIYRVQKENLSLKQYLKDTRNSNP